MFERYFVFQNQDELESEQKKNEKKTENENHKHILAKKKIVDTEQKEKRLQAKVSNIFADKRAKQSPNISYFFCNLYFFSPLIS